ncbi:PREDICTED: osteopontin isoform X1 [Pseudopodoces humilis]|uniref:osteopontin isoform X1 n=1 Tax=Pseudopodoces humilis TaxID=181119 RepID=UPI00039587A6|nr:PREDICTED: osteopontin isoform X1 [Pseudopodoces humilis]
MKEAVLILCLISITAAWPVIQSKQHAISASSEEKYDSRGHHLHRYHNDHENSQSQESQQHPQSDLASSQQTLYSSEESVDVPEQLHFPDVSSKSHEDVDDDDDDDDNDSNDTDESEEVVTSFPTDIPVTEPFPTFPFTQGDNAGRGDSVAYRMKAKATLLKSIKLHKAAKKLIYDATEEDESYMDADSQRSVSREDSASRSSLRKHASSVWSEQSHGRDSSEQDSDPRHRSLENDSWHKSASHEAEGDSSKSGVRGDSLSSMETKERGDSHPSVESRESRDRVSAELSDGISNQTLESAEDSQDRHSIESNEVTL